MFSSVRQRALEDHCWSIRPDQIEFIEAWKYSPDPSFPGHSVRFGSLSDDDVDDWLQQRGEYAPPAPPSVDAKPLGGIRLIISEQEYYRPPSYSLSKESYLRIEKEFHLPHVTLAALSIESGAFSRYKEYDENNPKKLRRIAFLIRAPQKYQVANYGLAVSYDFTSGFTTGLLHGTGVVSGGSDFSFWQKSPSSELFNLIREVAHLSAQPLLLPTILLQHHLYRTEVFCENWFGSEYSTIQRRLGSTRAGRLHRIGSYEDPLGEKTINETRVNLRNLTGQLNTFMTEIIWYCKVSEWHIEYVDFLAQAFHEVVGYMGSHEDRSYFSDQKEIKDCIAYLGSAAKGLKRHNTGMKERAEVDFSLLYSIIAQLDNRLNAKMSASASRDSTAMKTLAFITTLFLPGTFVATIFSTGMFSWQDSESDVHVVSPYFWVYWAVTVPLTIIVAVAWRLWWNWEKRNFDQDVRIEIENIEEPTAWYESKEPPGKGSNTWPANWYGDPRCQETTPTAPRLRLRVGKKYHPFQ